MIASDITRLSVRALTRGPLEFETKYEDKELDLGENGPKFSESICIKGNVQVVDDQVIAQAKLQGKEQVVCARCLEESCRPFEKEYYLAFEVSKEPNLNLLPAIREEVLLDQPLQVLCRPNCKGLCEKCGANLNHAPCAC